MTIIVAVDELTVKVNVDTAIVADRVIHRDGRSHRLEPQTTIAVVDWSVSGAGLAGCGMTVVDFASAAANMAMLQ